jgi:hypothetical protein
MGFRIRKSIPIGKFFRINLSRRGIGSSVTIPGTGLSWVSSPGRGRAAKGCEKQVGLFGCLSRIVMGVMLGFLGLIGLGLLASLAGPRASVSPPASYPPSPGPPPSEPIPASPANQVSPIAPEGVETVTRRVSRVLDGRLQPVDETGYWIPSQYSAQGWWVAARPRATIQPPAHNPVPLASASGQPPAPEPADPDARAKRAATFLMMGQNLERAGKPKPALENYRRVVEEFGDTPSSSSAAERVKSLAGE